MKTIEEIEKAVCKEFGVEAELLHTKSRVNDVALYRYIVCYLARKMNKTSNKYLSCYFEIDHSTVSHGNKLLKCLIDVDRELITHIQNIKKELNGEGREEIKDQLKEKLVNIFVGGKISTMEYGELNYLINKL